jgi:hypothetical protein
MKILNYNFNILNKARQSSLLNIIFIFVSFLIIFFSTQFHSLINYFWMDFIYAQFSHNQNLSKDLFEVVPNSYNTLGIPVWILEPFLNPLSKFAYNISSKQDYIIYLYLLRSLEILTLLIFLFSFSKKIEIFDISILLFLYVILLVNFNRYDHEPYMNFPIIVFCAFHALAVKIKKDYLFFILLLIGNLWAYLINPIVFFLVCFLPLAFFYSYFFYKKEYKKFLLALLANLPFAIFFVLMSLGNSRFALSDFFTGAEQHHNFSLFESKNFAVLTILFIFLSIFNLKKNNFYSVFFIIFTIISLIVGIIFYQDPQGWKIPSPYQIEYSLQFIIIFVFYKIIKELKQNKILLSTFLILLTIFVYRSYFFIETYNNLKITNNESMFYDKKKQLPKKKFWSDSKDNFFIKDGLKQKRLFIFLPNKNSKFHNSYIDKEQDNSLLMDMLSLKYNINLNGSLIYTNFWEQKIVLDQGYSFNLDINTVLANFFNPSTEEFYNTKYKKKNTINLTNGRVLSYLQVPKIDIGNKLLNFYKIEYILTDIKLDAQTENGFKFDRTYEFKEFNFFLYKRIAQSNDYKIKKISIINNHANYKLNIEKFNSELFVSKEILNKVKYIKNFCDIEIIHKDNKILFHVIKVNENNCLAVFPIPFSNNNLFEKKNDKSQRCENFRVPYYFHGCLITKNEVYILKKNNVFLYPFNSLRDYIDFKKLNLKYKNLN